MTAQEFDDLREVVKAGLRRCRHEDAPARLIHPADEHHVAHMVALALVEHGVTLAADREPARLTDEESARIVRASIAPDRVLAGRDGHEGSPPDVLLVEVERILADREPDGLRAAVEALAERRDVKYPEKFEWGADRNYLNGYRAAQRHLRAALAAHPATDQPEVTP